MTSVWSSSTFREALVALVRRRVPEKDAEDVVQATLTEAMASAHRPEDPEALRKWIYGITRNKIADYHRRARREVFEVPEGIAPPLSEDVDDLLRWAVRELPSGNDVQTLQWLLREGEGEKLETIAEGEKIPPARVRQRVSRLRKHYRARWAAQMAALAALGIVGIVALFWFFRSRSRGPETPIAHDTVPVPQIAPSPREQALKERNEALLLCDQAHASSNRGNSADSAQQWKDCIAKLDHAAGLAAEINDDPDVKDARAAAAIALSKPDPRDSQLHLPETRPTGHGSDWYAPIPSATARGNKVGPPRRTGKPTEVTGTGGTGVLGTGGMGTSPPSKRSSSDSK